MMRPRLALLAAATLLLGGVARPSDHAAHHPDKAAAGPSFPPAAGRDPGAADRDRRGEAEGMMEGHHSDRSEKPFYSSLLAIPDLAEADRQRLAREAEDRLHRGAALILGGSSRVVPGASADDLREAREMMREGQALFESGVAAKAGLADPGRRPDAALDWYRTQMNLGPARAGDEGLIGLGPGHWLFMVLITLLAAGLLALQWLRLRRSRQLVEAFRGKMAGRIGATPPAGGLSSPAPSVPPWPSSATAPSTGRSLPWSGRLRVAQVVQETPTIKTFRLVSPEADRLPFEFLPGQFALVEVEPTPGTVVRRSYTIASSPTQRAHIELTVKREAQGAVSVFLHDRVAVGDLISVTSPFGAFTFTGTNADSIVLIAGGVGITPMMSVLRYLTDTAWPGEIFFLYGARSTEEFVFREEIERLERSNDRLHVLATMPRSPGTVWLGPEGPLTKELLKAAVPEILRRRVHLCGPPPMMNAVRRMLNELGVPDAQIHSEAFGPASLPASDAPEAVGAEAVESPAPPPAPAAAPGEVTSTITFSVSGISAALRGDQTILEAAEGAGVEIPFVCRSGECGVCVTRLLEGQVSMAVETGLAPEDKAQGYVLACQARTTGGALVVEA